MTAVPTCKFCGEPLRENPCDRDGERCWRVCDCPGTQAHVWVTNPVQFAYMALYHGWRMPKNEQPRD